MTDVCIYCGHEETDEFPYHSDYICREKVIRRMKYLEINGKVNIGILGKKLDQLSEDIKIGVGLEIIHIPAPVLARGNNANLIKYYVDPWFSAFIANVSSSVYTNRYSDKIRRVKRDRFQHVLKQMNKKTWVQVANILNQNRDNLASFKNNQQALQGLQILGKVEL